MGDKRSVIKPLLARYSTPYEDVREEYSRRSSQGSRSGYDETYRQERAQSDAARISANMLAWVNAHSANYTRPNKEILTIVFSGDYQTQCRAAFRFEAMGKAMRIMNNCGQRLPRCPAFEFGIFSLTDYYARGRVIGPPRVEDNNIMLFYSYLHYARQAQYYGAKE